MLRKSLPVYSRHDGKQYLELVPLQAAGSPVRVQRLRSTTPRLESYWVMWLRQRLLSCGAPLGVSIVRDDRSLEIGSATGSARLLNTVQGIASELRPLPRLPMQRDNQRSQSNLQRWDFKRDHGITDELMRLVVASLNDELPRGVVLRGEVWGIPIRSYASLTMTRRPLSRPAQLTMGQLAKWVEWRFAEALASSRA